MSESDSNLTVFFFFKVLDCTTKLESAKMESPKNSHHLESVDWKVQSIFQWKKESNRCTLEASFVNAFSRLANVQVIVHNCYSPGEPY
jgi:hypothetical protein